MQKHHQKIETSDFLYESGKSSTALHFVSLASKPDEEWTGSRVTAALVVLTSADTYRS